MKRISIELYERQFVALIKVFEENFPDVASLIDGNEELKVLAAIEYLIKVEEKENGT